jgi:hypothetical protein
MGERIHYYMDEHVPSAVTEGLRRRGVDVLTAQEDATVSTPDRCLLLSAHSQGRVLCSLDADFLRLHDEGVPHAGIAYASQGTPVGRMVRGLMLIHDVLTPQEMKGHVEFL